jgi:hypothetical protein
MKIDEIQDEYAGVLEITKNRSVMNYDAPFTFNGYEIKQGLISACLPVS